MHGIVANTRKLDSTSTSMDLPKTQLSRAQQQGRPGQESEGQAEPFLQQGDDH